MTRDKIVELIAKKKIELEKPFEKDSGYDYCREYVLNNDISDIVDFPDVDVWHLMKCLYYINNKDKSIEEIEESFESFKPFFESTNLETISQFIEMTLSIDAAGNIDNVINYLDNKNIFKSAYKLASQAEEDLSFLKKLQDIKKYNNNKEIDMANYFRCYKEQGDDFLKIMGLYKAYRFMHYDIECLDERIANRKVKDKDRKSLLKKMYKDLYDVNRLMVDISRVKSFVDDEDKREKQTLKNNNKEIYNLDVALDLLDKGLEKEEITNAREIISKIKDTDIKYAFLELISEHNNSYYEILYKELLRLNKDSRIKYQALLNDYGITNGSYKLERIMSNSLEDVETMLKIITKFNINTEQIIKILKNSNVKIVLQIKDYLEKGYLSLDFLTDNIDIFYKNSSKYQIYNTNLETITSYGINPSIFFDSIEMLFIYPNLLKDNIELLSEYNLLNSIKTTDNYYFLRDKDLVLKIDKIIELGYEDYLEEDLNILNSDKLLRIEALKYFEMDIDNKQEFDSILNSKKFFIEDELLTDYIPNKISLKDESYDVNLEDYRNTNRTYKIGNVVISSNKVKRLLKNGYGMHDAIFSEMSLSLEDYNEVINNLKGYEYHK